VKHLNHRLQDLQAQFAPSPLTSVKDKVIQAAGVEVWFKRDDLLHPIISGNKWRKLKYILSHALAQGNDTLVSMGGAYSNHLHALAYVGKLLGLKTIAYVRGEQPKILNPTLRDLKKWGMELRFVSRSDYRQLRSYKGLTMPDLEPRQYWLPEGGAADLALQGVAEIVEEIFLDYDYLMVACGTGTTLAGLIAAAPSKLQLIGVSALKGADFLVNDVNSLLDDRQMNCAWQIMLDYHFGGFGKSDLKLTAFMQKFTAQHEIALEPIYTGKLVFALYDLLNKNYFKSGQRIVVLHTGGLQGVRH